LNYKNYFSFLLLVGACLLFGARAANACSCGPTPDVLQSYEGAHSVVVTRVVSVEKTEKAAPAGRISDGENYVGGVKSTKMLVERVFKGNLKVGEEITFGQGGGADCIWTFEEENIGQQFLFYLYTREKNPKLWYGFGCGRSRMLAQAREDLLYLNRLDKVRGRTRISGTIIKNDGEGDWSVEGRRIRINGEKKSYEVKTDEHGVYEIYDLPAGKYTIEPETPAGWKVDKYYLSTSSSFAPDRDAEVWKKIPVILEEKKHASLDIHFEIDNAIRGKIHDPAGKPLKDVCVKALLADNSETGYHVDCTDMNGAFAITELPPGSYILVINEEGKISSKEPFKTFYYPNVFAREKATVINIGAGDHLAGFNIYAPRMEEIITIEGRFLYSDGKPVAGETVAFVADKTSDGIEGDARTTTDAQGRFSIRILKNLKGELFGQMYIYAGEFEKCPKLEEEIKRGGGSSAELKTPVVEIQAEGDLQNVDLKYPFPGCRKAKQTQ
jgi:uncharacterized GH25 family protein